MMYYNNKRLALTVFWIVLGAVLVVLTVTEVLDSSIYSGMGWTQNSAMSATVFCA